MLDHDPGCLDLPDSAGDTALHCAVDIGDATLLQFLLDRKPKINAQNLNPSEYASGNWLVQGEAIMPLDKTPLHLAIDGGETECAELLLKAGELDLGCANRNIRLIGCRHGPQLLRLDPRNQEQGALQVD